MLREYQAMVYLCEVSDMDGGKTRQRSETPEGRNQ